MGQKWTSGPKGHIGTTKDCGGPTCGWYRHHTGKLPLRDPECGRFGITSKVRGATATADAEDIFASHGTHKWL